MKKQNDENESYLYVLRHGKAGKRMENISDDAKRPLTPAGRRDMKRAGKSLAGAGIKLDLVATSPLSRAQETASLVAESYNGIKLEEWEELSLEGSRSDLYKKLAKLDPGTNTLLVGHEPYLSTMIGELISTSSNPRIVLRKGGLAKVRVTTATPKLSGELEWLLTPKQIRQLC